MDELSLRCIAWNANGLFNHSLELKYFLQNNEIDLALISETHFTHKHFLKLNGYKIFKTNHPDGTGHGGTAIIVRNKISCVELEEYRYEHIQATNIQIKDEKGPITISALYCPPKHNITTEQYSKFFNTLGNRFIAGGDFNAKNTIWGSRLTNNRGKNLLKAIQHTNAKHLSTGEPTYWPTDPNKIPDLLDFCVIKNLERKKFKISSRLELSSDHSPIMIEYTEKIEKTTKSTQFCNSKTCWDSYKEYIERYLDCKIALKTPENIESAILHFNDTVIQAAQRSTPNLESNNYTNKCTLPASIKQQIKAKRKIRKQWQKTRLPAEKTKLNQATKDLKDSLKNYENAKINRYLKALTPNQDSNYSLWKATKHLDLGTTHQPPLKRSNGSYAKTNTEKAATLADYFEKVFSDVSTNQETLPTIDADKSTPIYRFSYTNVSEIEKCINGRLSSKKTPGYDMISAKMLKHAPENALIYIRNIFNAVFRLKYYPKIWKVAQVIPVPKTGKNTSLVSSYRPISILPMLSKVMEKLILDRLQPLLDKHNIVPNHQFGFRCKHSTVQQVHRVTHKITKDFENKKFCVALYLDVEKAFDKVWLKGLLHKLKHILPDSMYTLFKSYLSDRMFYINVKHEFSTLRHIQAGVPQGSVLGPILYTIYTADIPQPVNNNSMIATFADDTVVLSSHENITAATRILQETIDDIMQWFRKWNIKINEQKSVQVIYSIRPVKNLLPININEVPVRIADAAKYLGIYIDNKLSWKLHIEKKREHMKLKVRQLLWLLCKNSKLSLNNKLLIYNSILKPIWTYGIQIWGVTKQTNLKILQRQQNKILRIITNANWFMKNDDIHRDLNINTVREEIKEISKRYHLSIHQHVNPEIMELPHRELVRPRRLKRLRPVDLRNESC